MDNDGHVALAYAIDRLESDECVVGGLPVITGNHIKPDLILCSDHPGDVLIMRAGRIWVIDSRRCAFSDVQVRAELSTHDRSVNPFYAELEISAIGRFDGSQAGSRSVKCCVGRIDRESPKLSQRLIIEEPLDHIRPACHLRSAQNQCTTCKSAKRSLSNTPQLFPPKSRCLRVLGQFCITRACL
jgi:hypothetical protein